MAKISDPYQPQETQYDEGEAEYDAADYNYQIVDEAGDIFCLCSTKEDQELILKLLNQHASTTHSA